MSLTRVQQQPTYSLGNLGTAYGTRLEFVWPQAGIYSAAITVAPGDAFNLQGVPAGPYIWTYFNNQPDDPSLDQTVQRLVPVAMPPTIFGRRAIAKTGVVGTFSPWFLILQWNGAGNPLTG